MAFSDSFTVEGAHAGWRDEPILYRIRVPARVTGKSHPNQGIKYLTAPISQGASTMPDLGGRLLGFEAIPAGDWNIGHLVVLADSTDGKFVLASVEKNSLEAVFLLDAGPAWCDRKVDLLDLLDPLDALRNSELYDNSQDARIYDDIQYTNRIGAAVIPTPASISAAAQHPEVVGVWVWQPGHAHGIENESQIYSIIQTRDPGLAPRFIAHITDNNTRVIGFVLEHVTDAREAGPEDLQRCRDALKRLHALGIAYGVALGRQSFLVCGSDALLLQRFGGSFKTTDKEVLDRELESLDQALAQKHWWVGKFGPPVDTNNPSCSALGQPSGSLNHRG